VKQWISGARMEGWQEGGGVREGWREGEGEQAPGWRVGGGCAERAWMRGDE
jgi:hypothetical protein